MSISSLMNKLQGVASSEMDDQNKLAEMQALIAAELEGGDMPEGGLNEKQAPKEEEEPTLPPMM